MDESIIKSMSDMELVQLQAELRKFSEDRDDLNLVLKEISNRAKKGELNGYIS